MYFKLFLSFLVFSIILIACKKETVIQGGVVYDDTPYELQFTNNTLPPVTLPDDNPLTIQKVKLGKMLFFEKALSLDNSINCASCHRQSFGFSDPNQLSQGVGGTLGKRQSMAIFNLAWHSNEFFWDGRAHLLRDQSLMPIEDHLEMKETLSNVIQKLNGMSKYRNQFLRAFGTSEINSERISLALENFMLTIISEDSKYDRYLAGTEMLNASEERGRVLFFAEYNPFFPELSGADCAHCHAGNNFENDLYMNNGLDTDAEFLDFGRENATNNPNDRAKFKIPTLRNIQVTGPYMHDGRFTTLEEVIEHYNSGVQNSTTVDPALLGTTSTGLMLDAQDKIDLVNFLKTLTDYTFLNNPEYQP